MKPSVLLVDLVGRLKYRYYAGRPKSGYQLRYCFAVEKSTAGGFLTWEERITPTVFHRGAFDMWTRAIDAQKVQRSRFKRRHDVRQEEVEELDRPRVGDTE